jgi:hypothetical protein
VCFIANNKINKHCKQGRAYLKLIKPSNIDSREQLADAIAYSYNCFRNERFCKAPCSVDLICLLRAIMSPFDRDRDQNNEVISAAATGPMKKDISTNIVYRFNCLLVPKSMRVDVDKQYLISKDQDPSSSNNNNNNNNNKAATNATSNTMGIEGKNNDKNENGTVAMSGVNNVQNTGGGGGTSETSNQKSNNNDSNGNDDGDVDELLLEHFMDTMNSKPKRQHGNSTGDLNIMNKRGVEFVVFAVSIRAALLCRQFLLVKSSSLSLFISLSLSTTIHLYVHFNI